jgi:hypothetical protein
MPEKNYRLLPLRIIGQRLGGGAGLLVGSFKLC